MDLCGTSGLVAHSFFIFVEVQFPGFEEGTSTEGSVPPFLSKCGSRANGIYLGQEFCCSESRMQSLCAQAMFNCALKIRGDHNFEIPERFCVGVNGAAGPAFFGGFGTAVYLSCG